MSRLNDFSGPYASAAEINTGTEAAKAIAPDQFALASRGKLVQVAHAETGAVATGTTTMPQDNTIPQKTEGDEYLTCAITPKSTSNLLVILANIYLSNDGSIQDCAALFQDATSNALVAGSYMNATQLGLVSLVHKMTAGTTSATTFKLRAGPASGATVTVNGRDAARLFGGVLLTSITIFEYAP